MAECTIPVHSKRSDASNHAHPGHRTGRDAYGYFRIYILRREGWVLNHERVYRLYREDGLSLRLKRPRRHISAAQRERQAAALALDEMWSMDFVSDALFYGYQLRALTFVDAYTRESLAIDVDKASRGAGGRGHGPDRIHTR